MPSPSHTPPESSPALTDDDLTTHVDSSNAKKGNGNAEFGAGQYADAIQSYEDALSDLTETKAEFEKGVLKANIAAGWLKLEEWEKAIGAAGEALEALERADPRCVGVGRDGEEGRKRKRGEEGRADASEADEGGHDGETKDGGHIKVDEEQREGNETNEENEGDQEVWRLSSEDEVRVRKSALLFLDHNDEDIERMRGKVLLRRATARLKLGGWAALQGADEDYKQLEKMSQLSPTDRKTVQKALKELPPRLEEAKQKEMSDMMGKLKQLGNGILKPFGLSTDNFSMAKDEKTGGYNLQFNQNR